MQFSGSTAGGFPPLEISFTPRKVPQSQICTVSLLMEKSNVLGLGARGQCSPMGTIQRERESVCVCVCVCVCVLTLISGH